MSATSSSSTTSAIHRCRPRWGAGRWRTSTSRAARRRTRRAPSIASTMLCAAATRCSRAAGDSGIGIIDVSDITKPKTLARYEYNPPHTEQTHTFFGVPHSIGGNRIAVSTEEERANRGPDHGKPHAPLRTWDVTDPTKPKILCTYELPKSATPYDTNVCRFGTHQLREKVDADNLLYVTWFAGGLRIMDISIRPGRRSGAISSRRPATAPTRRSPTTSTRTTVGSCTSPTRSANST